MVLQMVKGLGRIQRTNFLKTGDVWVAVFKQGKQLGELLSELLSPQLMLTMRSGSRGLGEQSGGAVMEA